MAMHGKRLLVIAGMFLAILLVVFTIRQWTAKQSPTASPAIPNSTATESARSATAGRTLAGNVADGSVTSRSTRTSHYPGGAREHAPPADGSAFVPPAPAQLPPTDNTLSSLKDNIFRAGVNSGGAVQRAEIARRLATALATPNNAEVDPSSTIALLLEMSPTLRPADFSAAARSSIASTFGRDLGKSDILLAGMAGVSSVQPSIDRLAAAPIPEPESGRFYGTPEWAASLVKARQGEGGELQEVLGATRQADLHTRTTVLLTDLAYTAQPDAVNYLNEVLASDARLEPVKPTVPGSRVAAFAATELARMLADFPVPYKDDHSYSDEEIKVCREWMATQTAWRFRCDVP